MDAPTVYIVGAPHASTAMCDFTFTPCFSQTALEHHLRNRALPFNKLHDVISSLMCMVLPFMGMAEKCLIRIESLMTDTPKMDNLHRADKPKSTE